MSEQTNFMETSGGSVEERVAKFKATREAATALQSQAEPIANYDPDFDIEDHTKNSSGDEDRYGEHFRFIGSYTKFLQHDDQGRLKHVVAENVNAIEEYRKLIAAMQFDPDPNAAQKNGDINHVKRATDADGNEPERVWINPQSAFAYSNTGGDISFFKMRKPPALASKENAAEMIEVYLQALCRDVDFSDYGTGAGTDLLKFPDGTMRSITQFACDVLNDFGADFRGQKQNRLVTPETLFRGVAVTAGNKDSDLIGGYISQFLLQPLFPLFPAGCAPFIGGLIGVNNLNQEALARPQHFPIAGQREFGISFEEYVQIQNGEIPRMYVPEDYNQERVRHLRNGRDMGSLVHTDGPYEAYYNALNILVYNDFPRCEGSPYVNGAITNQGDGHTFGPPDIYALIGEACIEAFKAAWAQKWRLHRKLRPEAMGRIIHRHMTVERHPAKFLHPSAYTGKSATVLEMINERNKAQAECCSILTAAEADTFLLPLMYPEGSPGHPAYPSGHATVAGACTTVIKAIFDDTHLLHESLGNDGNGRTKLSMPHPTIEDQLVSIEGDDTPCNPYKLANSNQIKDTMTVGSELDKLASNIALGRNFGAVHYRQDGDEGILLGENVAIKYLQDRVRTYTENANMGYTLTKRNGQKIRITADNIELIGGSSPAA